MFHVGFVSGWEKGMELQPSDRRREPSTAEGVLPLTVGLWLGPRAGTGEFMDSVHLSSHQNGLEMGFAVVVLSLTPAVSACLR